MKKQHGFNLIELLVFIIITGLLGSTILLSLRTILVKTPDMHNQLIANQTAKKCMEWMIGQDRIKGYTFTACPSSTVPSFCTTPSGFSLSVNITCTTLDTDTNYKTIAITVSGLGDASLSTLIAAY